MIQAYCLECGKHTDQYPIVNSYALQCAICKLQTAGTQQAETEANKFYRRLYPHGKYSEAG